MTGARALLMICLLTLTACASTDAPPEVPAAPALQSAADIGTLAPRRLAAGECGMFLWTKGAEPKLVLFNARTGGAHAVLRGREVQLARAAADGTEVLGQFENQVFRVGDTSIQLTVGFERRAGLARGVVIPHGTMRVRREDGWEVIMPVGGLVACEEA